MKEKRFSLDSVPFAPEKVVCKKTVPDLCLLLDPNAPNWVIVNDIGREIVLLVNGERTLGEIAEMQCKKHNAQYEKSVDYILAFMNELGEKDFIREKPFPPPTATNKEDFPLSDIWLHVTNRCNLRCIHCHLSSGLPLTDEMTAKEICWIISEAEKLGVGEVHISGGGPLIRKDILKIVKHISQHVDSAILITNGTLITDRIAAKLREYHVRVQVSLDGAQKETNDYVRGKGSYKKTISGLKKLIKAGTPARIAMTLMKHNINEIDEMVDLAKKLGLSDLHFPILQMKGRAQENQALIELSDQDVVAAVRKMQEISTSERIRLSAAESLRREVEVRVKQDMCGAGISEASVAANGSIYPCAGLHENEFCAGNIREQTLEDIWKMSEVFTKLRSSSVLDIPECRACDFKFLCAGGCHVDKYYAYGRLDIPTPRCKQQQEIYWYLFSEKMKNTYLSKK